MYKHDIDPAKIATSPEELDVRTLPPWSQQMLFRAAIDLTKKKLREPGGRERLDAITAERMARKAARQQKGERA